MYFYVELNMYANLTYSELFIIKEIIKKMVTGPSVEDAMPVS